MAKAGYEAGLPHLLLSVMSVQGLPIISQLILARLVGPSDFGIIKTAESIVSILILIASAGMPSLAVIFVAEVSDPIMRRRLLGRLISVAFLSSITVSGLVTLMVPVLVNRTVAPYLIALVWVVGLTACNRTCLNYFQGIKQVHQISIYTGLASVVSLLTTTVLVWLARLDGWVVGRYLGEGLLLCVVLLPLLKHLQFTGNMSPAYSYRRLAVFGGTLSASLLVRTSVESAGVIALSWFGAANDQIGYYGVSTIIAYAVLMIVPSAVCNLALPRFVERVRDPEGVRQLFGRVTKACLFVTVPPIVVIMFLSPTLIRFFSNEYLQALAILQILLLSVPLRTMTVVSGTLLLACNRAGITLVGNTVTLAMAVVIYSYTVPRHGGIGAAWATVFIECFAMLFFSLVGLAQMDWFRKRTAPRISPSMF